MFIRRRLFGVILCGAICAGTVSAQTPPPDTPEPPPTTPAPAVTATLTPAPIPVFPITPGPSGVEGNINNTIPAVRYTFQATAGDSARILMTNTSGNLDPFLLFFGPDDEQLAFNDDYQTGLRDALIEMTLSVDGIYTIEATRFQQAEGRTSGTYRLTLTIAGRVVTPGGAADPLAAPPPFGVDFALAAYQDTQAGALDDLTPRRYYAVGGQQGDLVRVTMARTSGDLIPQITLRGQDLTIISREAQTREAETAAYATLPETGWYLIEAGGRAGRGSFTLYIQGLQGGVLQFGQSVSGELTAAAPASSYIFSARIGDQAFVTVTPANSSAIPQVTLLDLSLRPVAEVTGEAGETARLRTLIPRSGAYLLQITNAGDGLGGAFDLTLAGVPVDVSKLLTKPTTYNNRYGGIINADVPVDYFRFSGKAGELVTIQMTALDGDLDPYLILTDSQLNELAFNDNVAGSRTARITQFALPADGDYFILATRNRLTAGTTTGSYSLELSAGAIALNPGALTVTLEWATHADLNLFVRDPAGRTVSWSTPQVPSGGALQIDSNTDCETLSDLPVEHIYWPGMTAPAGDYRIWVWHQAGCGRSEAVGFSLDIGVGGQPLLAVAPGDGVLQPGERYEVVIRISSEGNAVILNEGQVTRPTAQQRASQGGDLTIAYSRSVTGTLNDAVYARFYQFNGAAGDVVTITAARVTGNLDPVVVLRDADDNNLARNDDAGPDTRDSLLTYTLPADGRYVIAVTRFGLRDGTTSGDFRLTLERAP